MIKIIDLGGPAFMIPLVITLLVILFLMIKGFIKEDSENNRALIGHLSLFALIAGILGTTLGLMAAFDAIAVANGISQQVLAFGLRIGLIPTAFGLSIFVLGRLGIIVLILKKIRDYEKSHVHSLLTAFFSTVFSNEGDKLRKEGKLAKAMEAYKTDYIKNPTNSKNI